MVWLSLFTIILLLPNTGNASTVFFHSMIDAPLDGSRRGVALAEGVDGELYILFDQPPAIWQVDRAGAITTELANSLGLLSQPVSMITDGGLELLVADQSERRITRLSRRLDILPPLIPILPGVVLEPVALARTGQFELLVLNGSDGIIYRYARDGRLLPLIMSERIFVRGNQPVSMHFSSSDRRLFLLFDGRVYYRSLHSFSTFPILPAGDKVTAFTISGNSLWFADGAVSTVNLSDGTLSPVITREDLAQYGVAAIAALAVVDKSWLWLLPDTGFPVVKYKIVDP